MYYVLLTWVLHREQEFDGGVSVHGTVEEVDGDKFDTLDEATERLVEYLQADPGADIWIAERG